MTKDNVTFILHKPQLSENIGACARGIKNFGFNKLALIDPKPLFPNDKIIATSVGAKDIIKKSKVYENLENLIGQIDILIATSARIRNKNIKHIELKDLKKINFKKKIGFLFGLSATPKIIFSKRSEALLTISWCPRVNGSNVPGYTAIVIKTLY